MNFYFEILRDSYEIKTNIVLALTIFDSIKGFRGFQVSNAFIYQNMFHVGIYCRMWELHFYGVHILSHPHTHTYTQLRRERGKYPDKTALKRASNGNT